MTKWSRNEFGEYVLAGSNLRIERYERGDWLVVEDTDGEADTIASRGTLAEAKAYAETEAARA